MICLFHRKKILKTQFDLLLEILDIKKNPTGSKGGSFFLGSWHTHPQDFVSPSFIDISDWKESIKEEKPAADFMVFVIVGRQEIGVWVGDNEQKKIIRIREKM